MLTQQYDSAINVTQQQQLTQQYDSSFLDAESAI